MSLYKFAVSFLGGILKAIIGFKASGKENIPENGAFLLCTNHHSNMDPVLIAVSCKRQLTFMSKEELFKVPVLGAIITKLGAFPIRRGKGDAGAVMATLKIMRRGDATLIFPEGTRVKKGERIQINSGIVRLAIQSKAPIIPAYVSKRTVTYGKPIFYGEYAEDVKDIEKMQTLADALMDTIYGLGVK